MENSLSTSPNIPILPLNQKLGRFFQSFLNVNSVGESQEGEENFPRFVIAHNIKIKSKLFTHNPLT
jgi:hypothetical protein